MRFPRLCAMAMALFPLGARAEIVMPPGFAQTLLASNLSLPAAFDIAPDGRIFIVEQRGRIMVVQPGGGPATVFANLAVDLQVNVDYTAERGLTGIALDPDFATNGHIFLYYTASQPQSHNRLSRVTAQGNVMAAGSEVALLDLPNVGNGIWHMGGSIQFDREGKILLAVADNGCGMDTATLSQIFEPFFTTKEVGKGTSLGLATVYGIVTNQDGWIEVASQVGTGTTFEIFIPITARPAEPVRPADSDEVRGGHETILLVEDEPAVREIMTLVLREHGYEVIVAADGREAIDLWSTHRREIDLLVTDIVMPNGVRGNMLAEQLQAERGDLKVILASGYSSEFGTESAPLSEGCNFLEKPYRPEVLVRTVRECLDR